LTGEGSRYLRVLLSADPYDPDRGLITLTGLLRRAGINLSAYVGSLIPVNLFPSFFPYARGPGRSPVIVLISCIVIAVMAVGGYRLRRRALVLNLYLLGYMAIYLAWPEVWRSERFMLPITPILAIYFLKGLSRILTYFGLSRTVAAFVCLGLALTNLHAASEYIQRYRGYPPGWKNYIETATWVGAHTEPNSLVLCRKPFLFHVFSDRQTISYPFTRDVAAMQDYLRDSRPDYIVMDNFGSGSTQRYLVPALEGMSEHLQTVYATKRPVNLVLKFSSDDAGDDR
jgi:hypothetical protein